MITLYKKGSSDKMKVWSIELKDGNEITYSGYHNGKMKATSKKVTGNAEKKMETKVLKKKREGYLESLEEAENSGPTLSGMQAMSMTLDEAKRFVDLRRNQKLNTLVDYKMNGVRGTYFRELDIIQSKGNKTYDVPHIHESLRNFCDDNGFAMLDFEFYCHGMKVNEIASLVKNKAKDQTSLVAFIFDGLNGLGDLTPAVERRRQIASALPGRYPYLSKCISYTINASMDLENLFTEALNSDHEGLVLRIPELPYDWDNKGRRSEVMVKVKPLYSDEFQVVGHSYEKRKVNGKWYDLILYTCVTEDGTQFTVTPEGDFESRCVDATPKGAWYTVEYRELTVNGIPFHAVGKGFRIEEDLDNDLVQV